MGVPLTQFRTLADTKTRILGAAYPIFSEGDVMGAVVVDQNMNGLRTFRNQALEQLFNTMLAVMLIIALGLFFFASSNLSQSSDSLMFCGWSRST